MLFVSLYIIMPLAAFLFKRTMEKLIVVSGKPWKRLLMLFACWLLQGMVIFIGDAVNILLTIPFFLLVVQIACEGSFWKKLTMGLMFSSTVFAFSALRDNFLLPPHKIFIERGRNLFTTTLCTTAFAFALYLGIRKFAPDRDYRLSDTMWRLLLLLTITPVGIILSVVVLHNSKLDRFGNGGSDLVYFALFAVALFSIIGLLWTVTVLARQQKLEEQNMMAEINRSYYETMEEQHFAIRRLKHDLTNHLSTMMAMPEMERESYIRNLVEDGTVTRALQYCGDVTVNAVLSVKEEQMKRYHIHLKTEIEIPDELPFEKTDVCALFANVLDNAVEACRKLEADRREIFLKSKAQKGLFCLEVTNPVMKSEIYGEDREKEDVRPDSKSRNGAWIPATSKPDKENHGLGLRSVREIAERHHGAVELKMEEGWFEVFLYMPLE